MSNSLTIIAPSQGSAKNQVESDKARARSLSYVGLTIGDTVGGNLRGMQVVGASVVVAGQHPSVLMQRSVGCWVLVNRRERDAILREPCSAPIG